MSSKILSNLEDLEIFLYEEPSVDSLDFGELASYLREYSPANSVSVRESLVSSYDDSLEDLAREFASVRVKDVRSEKEDFSDPMLGEVRFEEDLLKDLSKDVSGVLYDAFLLSRIYFSLLSRGELGFNFLHVVFTNRLFGTFSEGRYHARVCFFGFPSMISTSGIVEGPAKPKEFYEEKRRMNRLGKTGGVVEELKDEFEGRFIDYDDERLTEVMKGYVMQAVFYQLFLDPFCDSEECRLYNAHWQEEVIRAQLEDPEFCDEHEKIVREWRNS